MAPVSEIHFRVFYLVAAVGVLLLLRKPLRNPDKPGSKWFALTIVALSTWLGAVGLYYVARDLPGALVLYSIVMFSVTVCFVGWTLIAVEFATGRSPPRPLLVALGAFAAVHLALLATNFVWLHELLYRSTTFVDEGGGLNAHRGPLFWVHIVIIYVLVFLSTALFAAEWAKSSGLRRRQAGILAITPVFGVGTSLLWFAEVLPFPYDPTPVGVTAGVVLLGWALFRADFLEIVPVASQQVVEEMTDAVVTLDDEDRIVDWNRAAEELFGVEGPTVGMAADEFFEPVPREALTEFARTGGTETHVSFELDGRERHFSVTTSPIETDHGLAGRVVVARDITGIKRRERQLLRQNEHLDEFAEIVSHDLQGPLMDVRGSADLAARTNDVSHVDHVLDAADRMEQRVDDLLQLARTGRGIDSVEPVPLADVAETAWIHVWSTNAELVVDTDHVVLADPDRLQQLFENLFGNSVEHGTSIRSSDAGDASEPEPVAATTDSQDTIAAGLPDDVTATRNGATQPAVDVRVTVGSLPDGFYVEDDGPGIPPDERERIFERGYTTSDDGMGLGLGIVRQIVGAHGWSVRATAGSDGGARFEITGVEVVRVDGEQRGPS